MRVWLERPSDRDVTRVVAEFSTEDLVRVDLNQFDLAMLRESARSGADILLDAELLARRIEQQHTKKLVEGK